MGRYRSLIVPGALVAVCLAAYFLVFLPPTLGDVGQASQWMSYDLRSFFLPKFVYGSRELAHGRFPLWNPYEYGGIPFFATAQPAVLYPPKMILFALFDERTAYWVFMVVHYVALAAGFLVFLQERKITGLAAFAGTATWTLAVPVLFSNYHPTRIANLAFVPLCFLLVERIGSGISPRRNAGWLVVLLALQLTAGYPEFTSDLGLLVAVHAATRFLTKEWTLRPSRSIPLFAGLFSLAALVAAVQLVPMVEAALVARRTDVAAAAIRSLQALPEQVDREVLFVPPGFYAFGIAALFLRRAIPATAGLALCVVIASVAWPVFHRVPGFSMLRFPFLWLIYSAFYAGWLVAVGVEAFLGDGSARSTKRTAVAISVLSLGWGAFCAFEWYRLRVGGVVTSSIVHRLDHSVRTPLAAGLGVLGSLSLAAISVPQVRGKVGRWTPAAVFALLIFSHEAAFPFGSRPAAVARPGPVGEMRNFIDSGVTRSGRVVSIPDIANGYDLTDEIPTLFGAEESFVPWRFRLINEHVSYMPNEGRIDWAALVFARGFIRAMNLEYVIAPRELIGPFMAHGFKAVRLDRRHRALLKSPPSMGEAWVNFSAVVVPSEAGAREYVLGQEFEPSTHAVVEEALGTEYPPQHEVPPSYAQTVRHISATAEEIELELPRPGVLVVSESYYPGWTALLDGRPARVFVADYVLRAVEVPAGAHRVVFEYRPASVRWGAFLSVLGLVLLTALFAGSNEPAPPKRAA